MDEASLWRTLTTLEDDGEITWAVEYRIGDRNGELVHRSAHVVLKTAGAVAAMLTGNLGEPPVGVSTNDPGDVLAEVQDEPSAEHIATRGW